jgi:hypothetical protein
MKRRSKPKLRNLRSRRKEAKTREMVEQFALCADIGEFLSQFLGHKAKEVKTTINILPFKDSGDLKLDKISQESYLHRPFNGERKNEW